MDNSFTNKLSIFGVVKIIFRRYPLRFIVFTALLFMASLLEASSLASLLPLLGSLFEGESNTGGILGKFIAFFRLESLDTLQLILIVGCLAIGAELFFYFKDIVVAKINVDIVKDVRDELMENILFANWRFHLNQESGVVTNILHSETQKITAVVRQTGLLYTNFIIVLVLGTVSVFVMWEAVAIAALVGVLALQIIKILQRLSRIAGEKSVLANNKMNTQVIDNMHLNKYVKASSIEKLRLDPYRHTTAELANLSFKQLNYRAIVPRFNKIFATILICMLFFVFLKVIPKPIGNIMFLLLVFERTYSRFTDLQVCLRAVVSHIPGFEYTFRFLENAGANKESTGKLDYNKLEKGLRLNNVAFSYHQGIKVLDSIAMDIPKSSLTALVGSSGSGKSTIVDLILGLIHPDEGSVEIDGVSLKDMNVHSLRKRVGFVPQEASLIQGTIKENIMLPYPEATDKDVEEAAKLAHAHDFILKQSNGYDTLVGDRGAKLSGGQKQRITLARALITKPDILILDEATSSLDNESEKNIQEAILELKGQLTILVIAHRLSTVENADMIYFLKDGKVVESGNMEELKKLKGEFLKMYNLTAA